MSAKQLLSLVLYPVYGIPEQIRRRADVNAGARDLMQLSNVVNQFGDSALAQTEFSMAIADVTGYDATPAGVERPFVDVSGVGEVGVRMPYGPSESGVYNWVAVLTNATTNATQTTEQRYIMSGYTSRAEPTLLGRLPDEMRMFINDIYCIQATYGYDGLGQRVIVPGSFRVIENYVMSQVLADEAMHSYEFDINPIAMAKNADLQRKLNLGDTDTIAPTVNSFGQPLDPLNQGTVYSMNFQASPQLISTQLTNPTGLISTIAKGYIHATSNQNEIDTTVAGSFFNDNGTATDSFLRQQGVQRNFSGHELIQAMSSALSQVDGIASTRLGMDGNFTLGNLRNAIVNPQFMDNAVMNSINQARSRGLQMSLENTDDWTRSNGVSTPGSLVAFDIAMQIGPVLCRNMVGAIRFVYDNRRADVLTPAQLTPVENSLESTNGGPLDLIFAQRMVRDLEHVMLKASKHNRIPFMANITCRLGTVTRIELCMEGGVPEYFTHASFMSNRMHVGITTSNDYVGQLGKSVKNVMKAIDEGFEDFNKRSNLTNHNSILGGLSFDDNIAPTGGTFNY